MSSTTPKYPRILANGKAIGGYFELELPLTRSEFYPRAIHFQSARAAFLALLRAGQPRRVWMPKYICNAMLSPLARAGIDVSFYSINEKLEIAENFALRQGEWLLYVNYFGVRSRSAEQVLERFDPDHVVLDYSQAFYARPKRCLATLYSPRKFFGVPDGGLMLTNLPIAEPAELDTGSISRASYLLKRLSDSPEAGYADYKDAEESLSDVEPRTMSRLTRRMLESIDYQAVRDRRNENFRFLYERLKHLNRFSLDVQDIDGPLCYPLYADRLISRENLAKHRVFLPTYWPDVETRTSATALESKIARDCLPVPCDQRYSISELDMVVELIYSSNNRDKEE